VIIAYHGVEGKVRQHSDLRILDSQEMSAPRRRVVVRGFRILSGRVLGESLMPTDEVAAGLAFARLLFW